MDEKRLEREKQALLLQIENAFRGVEEVLDTETWKWFLKNRGAGRSEIRESIEFRDFVSAVMVSALRGGWRHIELVSDFTLVSEGEARHRALEEWSLLSREQRLCVKRFVGWMAVWHLERGEDLYATWWREAYDGYWANV